MSQKYYLKKTVGIYKVTNHLSGLCYVGQSLDVCERWKGHTSSRATLLGQAIHSDGIKNFSFQVLEECRAEELNSREAFWIHHFNCIAPGGYNKNAAPKVAPIDEIVNGLVSAGGSKKDVLAAKKMHLKSIWQSGRPGAEARDYAEPLLEALQSLKQDKTYVTMAEDEGASSAAAAPPSTLEELDALLKEL